MSRSLSLSAAAAPTRIIFYQADATPRWKKNILYQPRRAFRTIDALFTLNFIPTGRGRALRIPEVEIAANWSDSKFQLNFAFLESRVFYNEKGTLRRRRLEVPRRSV